MKPKLDKQLCKKYPYIFRDRNASETETCMCWGFPDDGWYKLIEDICEKIVEIKKKSGIQYVADQVKEKFGGLRFTCHDDKRLLKISREVRSVYRNELRAFISNREMESFSICEVCGSNQGKLSKTGWIKCLCDNCLKERHTKNK